MAQFDVILLGTGSPLPSPDRCGAGFIARSDADVVMIDCGWGAARRLIASGVPLNLVNQLFFTHLHSDHITDLPDLLMMRWTVGGATKPLTIYGPAGTAEMVAGFRAGLNPDVKYRFAHHGEKLSPEGIETVVHEVPATPDAVLVADASGFRVLSFEVDHRPVEPALGYRVERDGKSVVFSGDTRVCDSFARGARGADVLVSEAVNLAMMEQRINFLRSSGNERAAVMLEEACDYHAPTLEVAAMARDAGVGQIIIAHLIPPVPNEGPQAEAFLAGMSDIYGGPITLGRDLQKITVA